MSNKVVTKPTRESGLYKDGFLHKDGGIEVTVDGQKKIEVEVKEYKLCKEALENSSKQYEFKDKTNLEILDEIFQDNNCVFSTQEAKSRDFILCRLSVLDKTKRDMYGSAKDIVNAMQSEHGCNVSSDASGTSKEKGGNVSHEMSLEEAETRLEVLKKMQRRSPSRDAAFKITKLKKEIKSGIYKKGGAVAAKKEPAQVTAELIATHNTTYSKLFFADKLGGISMPSLAIVKATNPVMRFGDIILIASRQMVDPEKSEARVFDRDIYSPSYPKMYSHIDKKNLNKLENELYKELRSWGEYGSEAFSGEMHDFIESVKNGTHKPDVIEKSIKNDFVIYLWTKRNGVDIEIPIEPYQARYWHVCCEDCRVELFNCIKEKYPVLYSMLQHGKYFDGSEDFYRELAGAWRSNNDDYIKILKEEDKSNPLIEFVTADFEEFFDKKGNIKYPKDYDVYQNLKILFNDKKIVNYSELRERTEEVFKQHEHEIRKFVNDMLNGVIFGSYFFKNKTQKAETDIDNIFDYMTKQGMKASQKTLVFGHGNAAALGAKEYKSLSALARDKDDKIVTHEGFEAFKKKQSDAWDELVDKFRQYYKWDNAFDALDDLSRSSGQISAYANPTDDRIGSVLNKNGYVNVPLYLYDEIRNYAQLLKNSPTEYFEVKIDRIVPLSDFVAAVIPKDNEQDIKKILNKNGIKNISVYDKEGDREENISEAMNEVLEKVKDEVMFKNGGRLK